MIPSQWFGFVRRIMGHEYWRRWEYVFLKMINQLEVAQLESSSDYFIDDSVRAIGPDPFSTC